MIMMKKINMTKEEKRTPLAKQRNKIFTKQIKYFEFGLAIRNSIRT